MTAGQNLRERREALVREHMESENHHDFEVTLGTFGHPPLRAPVALATAATSELAWRTLPLRGEPPLTRLAYWLSAQECTIDITKARRDLGYEPVTSREDGLEEMRADA